jgi:hypothetical protein
MMLARMMANDKNRHNQRGNMLSSACETLTSQLDPDRAAAKWLSCSYFFKCATYPP